MPRIEVAVSHNLGQEEATRRLKDQSASAKARFGQHVSDLEEGWEGNVLSFAFTNFGVRVEGSVTSGDSEVRVEADLPLVAVPFRGAIEKQIRSDLEEILA
jgi:hypothetical protein